MTASKVVMHLLAKHGRQTTHELFSHLNEFPQLQSMSYLKRRILKSMKAEGVIFKRPIYAKNAEGKLMGKPVFKWGLAPKIPKEKYEALMTKPGCGVYERNVLVNGKPAQKL